MGDLKVYGMGDAGVNTSSDPLHTAVGDVTSAQNATFLGSGQRGGLSKRLGLRVFNATALGGAVLALLSVTIADPSAPTILVDGDDVALSDDLFLVLTE